MRITRNQTAIAAYQRLTQPMDAGAGPAPRATHHDPTRAAGMTWGSDGHDRSTQPGANGS